MTVASLVIPNMANCWDTRHSLSTQMTGKGDVRQSHPIEVAEYCTTCATSLLVPRHTFGKFHLCLGLAARLNAFHSGAMIFQLECASDPSFQRWNSTSVLCVEVLMYVL